MRVIDVLRWLYPGHWTYHRLGYSYGEWERDDGLLVREQPSHSPYLGNIVSWKVGIRHYDISYPVHGPVCWEKHGFHYAVHQNTDEDGVCLPPHVETLYHPELT